MKTDPIVFFGTPNFSVETLRSLHESGERKISLVVTQPDKPQGRGRKLQSTPVKVYCQENGLACEQPRKMKSPEFLDRLRKTESSLFIVSAFGRILPDDLLKIPQLIINVHASLLPRWRGAAPIARSIMESESRTGVSIMQIVKELDAGPYLQQESLEILPDETEGELRSRLAELGGKLILESIELLKTEKEEFTVQDESKVTFAPPVLKEEALINWDMPAQTVHNRIRAMNPNPGAYTLDRGKRIKVWRTTLGQLPTQRLQEPGTLSVQSSRLWVACSDLWIEILEAQREGKSKQVASTFLAGYDWGLSSRWTI